MVREQKYHFKERERERDLGLGSFNCGSLQSEKDEDGWRWNKEWERKKLRKEEYEEKSCQYLQQRSTTGGHSTFSSLFSFSYIYSYTFNDSVTVWLDIKKKWREEGRKGGMNRERVNLHKKPLEAKYQFCVCVFLTCVWLFFPSPFLPFIILISRSFFMIYKKRGRRQIKDEKKRMMIMMMIIVLIEREEKEEMEKGKEWWCDC